MKFTFKSEQCGATFEMTFEEEIRDDIELMFEQFMRGSGFHFIEDEEMYTEQENSDTSEECVHETDKKPWVGLTDDEMHEAAIKCIKSGQSVNTLIRDIEAKLKERNT